MASMGFPITIVAALLVATAGALMLTPKNVLRSSIVAEKLSPAFTVEVASVPRLRIEPEATPGVQFASLTVRPTPLEPDPIVTATVPVVDIRWITAKALNMRTEPNKDATLVTSLPFGTRVSVSDTAGTWALVTGPDGSSGWLSANFLTTHVPTVD